MLIEVVALRGVKLGFWFLLGVEWRITCGVPDSGTGRHDGGSMVLRGVKLGFWFLLGVEWRITCGVPDSGTGRHDGGSTECRGGSEHAVLGDDPAARFAGCGIGGAKKACPVARSDPDLGLAPPGYDLPPRSGLGSR